jgi:hypothetical protein
MSNIKCFLRVNPSSSVPNSGVCITREDKEIVLHEEPHEHHHHHGHHGHKSDGQLPPALSKRTWVMDEVVDNVPLQPVLLPTDLPQQSQSAASTEKPQFASQDDMWNHIEDEIAHRLESEDASDAYNMAIMALGAQGSGKTYTLFGSSNYPQRGLIPRFLDFIFDCSNNNRNGDLGVKAVLMSMYLVIGEEIIDVLHLNNPVIKHDSYNNLGYSKALGGPVPLPVQYVACHCVEDCRAYSAMGVRAAALLQGAYHEYYSSTSMFVKFTVIGSKTATAPSSGGGMFGGSKSSSTKNTPVDPSQFTIRHFTFIDAASTTAPQSYPINVDRLSGISQQFNTARQYQQICEAGAACLDSLTFVKEMLEEQVKQSTFCYLCQDVLFRFPNTILIGHLRDSLYSYADNCLTMDMMATLSTNHITKTDLPINEHPLLEGDYGFAIVIDLLKSEITSTKDTVKDMIISQREAEKKREEEEEERKLQMIEDAKARGEKVKEDDPLTALKKKQAKAAAAAAKANAKPFEVMLNERDEQFFKDLLQLKSILDQHAPPPPSGESSERKKKGNAQPSTLSREKTRRDKKELPVYEFSEASKKGDRPSFYTQKAIYMEKLLCIFDCIMRFDKQQTRVRCNVSAQFTPSFPVLPSACDQRNALLGINHRSMCHRKLQTDETALKKYKKLRDKRKEAEEDEKEEEIRRKTVLGGAKKEHFATVLRDWLAERGAFVNLGGDQEELMDTIDHDNLPSFLSDQALRGDSSANMKSASLDSQNSEDGNAHDRGNSQGSNQEDAIPRNTPWTVPLDSYDPYLLCLNPHSGLAEHYGKIPLDVGITLIRGKRGNFVSKMSALDHPLISSPIESDTIKDSQLFTKTLNRMVGDGLISRESLAMPDVPEEPKDHWEEEEDDSTLMSGDNMSKITTDSSLKKEKEKEPEYNFTSFLCIGTGVEALHCAITVENQRSISIRGNRSPASTVGGGGRSSALFSGDGGDSDQSETYVNGVQVSNDGGTALQDMDIIRLGAGRFFMVRVPMKSKRVNDPTYVEERFPQLNCWELGMVRSFNRDLRESIRLCLVERLHANHSQFDRNLTAVMKTADKTTISALKQFDVPLEVVNHIYDGINTCDRTYMTTVIGSTQLMNSWAKDTRKPIVMSFMLQETSKNDKKHKKVIRCHAQQVDLFIEPQEESLMDKNVKSTEVYAASPEKASSLITSATSVGKRTMAKYKLKNSKDDEQSRSHLLHYNCTVLCTNTGDTTGGKFLWNADMSIERLFLMKQLYESFQAAWCARDNVWLQIMYPLEVDPFQDAQDDDLIGVGYLYLDSLQYLIDVNDMVPIVSTAGDQVGSLKLKVRVWVDKMETSPAYLTIDKQRILEEFQGKDCILRVYFESMFDLPENQCSSTFVKFNFFNHSKSYASIRHGGASTHPFMHSSIVITQKITGDFLEYVKRASLELEVYGKKGKKVTAASMAMDAVQIYKNLGEVAYPTVSNESDSEGSMSDEEEEKKEGGILSEQDYIIHDLTTKLEKTEGLLQKNKEIASTVISEKKELERLVNSLQQQQKDLKVELQSEKQKASEASGVCAIS